MRRLFNRVAHEDTLAQYSDQGWEAGIANPRQAKKEVDNAAGDSSGLISIETLISSESYPVLAVDSRNYALSDCIEHDFGRAVQSEFLHHVRTMCLNCRNAETE
jgi:hypothetical protein